MNETLRGVVRRGRDLGGYGLEARADYAMRLQKGGEIESLQVDRSVFKRRVVMDDRFSRTQRLDRAEDQKAPPAELALVDHFGVKPTVTDGNGVVVVIIVIVVVVMIMRSGLSVGMRQLAVDWTPMVSMAVPVRMRVRHPPKDMIVRRREHVKRHPKAIDTAKNEREQGRRDSFVALL